MDARPPGEADETAAAAPATRLPGARPQSPDKLQGFIVTAALVAILLGAAAIRLRLLSVPLERDEGEYAYAGRLILEGIPPYRLAYNMKLPGTYAAYAAILALFGRSVAAIRFGLIAVNAATTWILFLLVRRLLGAYAALWAAAFFALISLGPSVLGLFGHATHFVLLPALAGLLLLLPSGGRLSFRRLFWSGVLLGLALLMKQHGAAFVLLGALLIAADRRHPGGRGPWQRLAPFALGSLLPLGITCLILALSGVFASFWFWTVTYARLYAGEVSLQQGLAILPQAFGGVVAGAPAIWGLASIGGVLLFLTRSRFTPAGRAEASGPEARRVLGGLLAASLVAIVPGFYFREHYFILLLPAVAALAGLALDATRRAIERTRMAEVAPALPALVGLVAILATLYHNAPILFGMLPHQVSRQIYGINPFPEAEVIARTLKARSGPRDEIAILGSEPEILFEADRRSPTGHIYMYGLMEPQPFALTMQEEAIAEIERGDPRFLVLVDVPVSWLARPDSPRKIFDWAARYVAERFDRIGLVDIVSEEETVYRWDAEAAAAAPRSPYHIEIYERR